MRTRHRLAGVGLAASLLLACSSKSPRPTDAARDTPPTDLPDDKDGLLADTDLFASDLPMGKDASVDSPLLADARDLPLADVAVADRAGDLGAVCTATSRLSCNDDPNASAVWGTCQADGTCKCYDGFVLNTATGRCTLPGRDARGDTDNQPGVCTGSYDACTCTCCAGEPTAVLCYYPSVGESIAAIAAEVAAKTLATDCTLAGCTRAVRYICCTPAEPEPAAGATYTVDGHAGGIDHLGVTKVGADCAQLSFVDGAGTSGFRIDAAGRWSVVSATFGSCADGGATERARGALGTLAFRSAGDQCLLDLHATLFAISATGEVKTARMDADGIPVPGSLPSPCR